MTIVSSSVIFTYTITSFHSTDPYARLFSEIVEHLEKETAPGGEFEGFFIYRNHPGNRTMHFPCLVIEMERGGVGNIFGREYDEGGTLLVKVMFTKKEFITIDVI
jgi:hypothetical protein